MSLTDLHHENVIFLISLLCVVSGEYHNRNTSSSVITKVKHGVQQDVWCKSNMVTKGTRNTVPRLMLEILTAPPQKKNPMCHKTGVGRK